MSHSSSSWFKRIGFGILALVVLAFVICFFCLGSMVKTGLETFGPKMTQTTVTVDDVSLSPLTGSGKIKRLVIGNPEGYNTPTALSLGMVKFNTEVTSLFSDVIHIEELIIDSPEVTYEASLGKSNIGKILSNVEDYTTSEDKTVAQEIKDKKDDREIKVIIDRAVVKGAVVRLGATFTGGKTIAIPIADIERRDIGKSVKGTSFSQAVNDLLQPLLDAVQAVAADPQKYINQGVDATKEAVNKGIDATKDAVNKGVDATKDAASKTKDATKDAVNKTKEVTKDAVDKTKDATKKAADNVKDFLNK